MSNYCTIYLVRHGETDWNKKRLVQGHTNTSLNSDGVKQAEFLKNQLSGIKFDAVFSSDLLRSVQTAENIASEHKLIVQTTRVLRERRYGSYEGKSFKELDKFYNRPKEFTKENKSALKKEGIETDDEVTHRLITFLREISVAYPDKKVLVVSHGGAIRLVINHLSGKKYSRGAISNTGYLEIQSDGVDFFIKSMFGIKDK